MGPNRIDDKTQVPLGIVAALFSTGITVSIAIAFWAAKVDARLSRIEEMLRVAHAPSAKPFETAWDVQAAQPGHRPNEREAAWKARIR